MKAKNPSTGNFEEVYVKALDSLPVGTTVDYVGQSSDIPIGWEIISGQNKIQKTSNTRALAGKVVNVSSESTTDAYSCDYINDCETYSTSETFTGKYWIDSKPIYRKVFTGTIDSSGVAMIVGNIQNINVITFSGTISTTNNRQHPIPTYWNDSIKNVPEYYKTGGNAGNIVLNYSSNYYGQDYELIVEYTKTAD